MTNKNLVTQLHETVFHGKTRLKFFVLLVNFWLHGTSINQSINQSIIYFNTLHQRAKKLVQLEQLGPEGPLLQYNM